MFLGGEGLCKPTERLRDGLRVRGHSPPANMIKKGAGGYDNTTLLKKDGFNFFFLIGTMMHSIKNVYGLDESVNP